MWLKIIITATVGFVSLVGLAFGSGCEPATQPFTGPRTLKRIGESPLDVGAETLNHGQKLFNRYCATCHGYEGRGDGGGARNLDPKPRDFQTAEFLYASAGAGQLPTDSDLRNTIREGVTTRGMPAWAGMRGEDLDALVSYIKTFSPRWQPDAAPSKPET
jgi:mono/diheme cytochrome c family protein